MSLVIDLFFFPEGEGLRVFGGGCIDPLITHSTSSILMDRLDLFRTIFFC
jgi:hypothetical protein